MPSLLARTLGVLVVCGGYGITFFALTAWSMLDAPPPLEDR